MLLSSVNFVAKPRSGKSKENVEKKNAGKKVTEPSAEIKEYFCEQCEREIEEEISMFKFPAIHSTDENELVFDEKSFKNLSGDRVTIATGDDLCLFVEQYFYTIGLREESRSDSTCIFRKKVLEKRTVPNGHVETVVFALDCDQEFYLTATQHRDLELNYHTSTPSLEDPDERLFDVYVTNLGHSLIQPKLCPNYYLHHIDKALSVQRLDLNWRCPEEYFFHFNAVPESMKPLCEIRQKVCTHNRETATDNKCKSSEKQKGCVDINALTLKRTGENTALDWKSANGYFNSIPEREKIELPTRRPMKKKLTFPSLLLGCFSSKSHTIYVQSP